MNRTSAHGPVVTRRRDAPHGSAGLARLLAFVGALLVVAWHPAAAPSDSPTDAFDAITELELDRAATVVNGLHSSSALATVLRARLLLYRGDCVAASTALSAARLHEVPEVAELGELAQNCAGATASAVVVEDRQQGLWLRFQDEADRALVPLLAQVATRARASLARDLGVELPRPLRIDLVRDQYSLAMVSGLPLQAAQTTGTVAVARWGRVIMVSPRATRSGFPWQDTLAHEMAHLAVSRASRDHAPLWLQEGIAKREETKWRTPRPLDDRVDFSAHARAALVTGNEVGIERLGPSIAMLPTPEAASSAYAEVASFVEFWIRENGLPALALFLLELKMTRGAEDADRALRSVTGYALDSWIARWKLRLVSDQGPDRPESPGHDGVPTPELVSAIRLGDLLNDRGFAAAATVPLAEAVRRAPALASVRARLGQTLLAAGRGGEVDDALGQLEGLDGLHAGWLASRGQLLRSRGDVAGAAQAFDLALGIQPFTPEAACGQDAIRAAQIRASDPATGAPQAAADRGLCSEAKAWQRR
jgi:hypothetical protein